MRTLTTHLNRRFFRLLPAVLIITLILSIIGPNTASADPGWYDLNWLYRKKITINAASVAADLTNFPVLVSLASDTDLAADALDSGNDILFTASDETTKLPHEIERFDGTTGKLVAWVKITNLSSITNTDIYMYYGNAGAANQQNVNGVWDGNYKMVQHLEETAGGPGLITDSTVNNNNGTDQNSPTFGANGKLDGAIAFTGASDQYINFANAVSLDITGTITIEAWIYPTSSMTNNAIVAKEHWINGVQYALFIYTGGAISFQVSDGSDWKRATGGVPSLNTWHHVVGVYNQSNVKVYLDTAETTGDAYIFSIPSTIAPVSIGDYYSYDGTYAFDGTIDEVRISNTARNADWILTSYNNQSNPTAFFSLGLEQNAHPPGVIGGKVFSVNKAAVLVPWILIGIISTLVLVRVIFYVRKKFKSRPHPEKTPQA